MRAKDDRPVHETAAKDLKDQSGHKTAREDQRDHDAVPKSQRGHNTSRKDQPGHSHKRIRENQTRHHTPPADPPNQESHPLLMVDIDGVISLFGFAPGTHPDGSFHSIDGIPHFLSARAAEHLLRLRASFELVWASGWEEKANEYLPHLLGLPRLAHLSFSRSSDDTRQTRAHWKLEAIEAYADGAPLAWIDDAFNDACHVWARTRDAPTLLVQTEPASGLTVREMDVLERWAETLVGERGA